MIRALLVGAGVYVTVAFAIGCWEYRWLRRHGVKDFRRLHP